MLKTLQYAAILFLCFALPQISFASKEEARDFVQGISDQTFDIVTSDSLSMEEKEEKLNALFRQSVDTDWIARFVMGRYWRKASTFQREKYTSLYTQFLVNSYVPKFKEYTNQRFALKKYSADSEEGEYLVQTEILSQDTSPIRVDYKVRRTDDGSYKIFDVIAEGISLITTQRSEFGSILSRNSIDFLIKKLEARV